MTWLDASVCLTGQEVARGVLIVLAVGAPAVMAIMLWRWRR